MSTDVKQAQGEIRDNIIELFGIDKLPEEQQEETIAQIGKIIFQAVLVRVLPLLEDEEMAEYDKLLESSPSPDELLSFFFDKVPGFLEIIAEESRNFQSEAESILNKIK
ncbi:MAG: hypothetical protein M3Q34_01270 [bacterium]|nr:hypothetical protein [bacterium]